jgi:hypothetical protein
MIWPDMAVSSSGEAGETVHCHSNTAFSGCLQDAEMIDFGHLQVTDRIRILVIK